MGKLVVIEGTDGSGKETQMKLLVKKLEERNIKFRKINFPNYSSVSSSLVKMYLEGDFGQDAKTISPYIASTFFAVDRYATFKKELEEYYKNGGILLADRYTTANMVHQAGKIKDRLERKKFLDWIWDFEFNIFKIPVPDKVFFLNMPMDYVEKLIKNRKNKFDEHLPKDIHERDDKHLKESYEAACEVAKDYGWDEIKCVQNGVLRTIEDIGEEIFKKLEEIL